MSIVQLQYGIGVDIMNKGYFTVTILDSYWYAKI